MIDDLMQRENYVLAKKLLDAAHVRQQALSSNIANIETPGYKRMDLRPDFAENLKRVAHKDDLEGIRTLRAETQLDLVSPNVRPDGNNVQIDQELLRMQQNSVQYQFLTEFTSNSLNRLKTALTGQVR